MPKNKKHKGVYKSKSKGKYTKLLNKTQNKKEVIYVMDSDEEKEVRSQSSIQTKKNSVKHKGSVLQGRKDLIVGLRNRSNGRSCKHHGFIPCGETLKTGDHIVFRKETFQGNPAVSVFLYEIDEADNNKLNLGCKVGFIPAKDVRLEAVAMGFNDKRGVIVDILDTLECDDDAVGFVEHYQGVAVFKFT